METWLSPEEDFPITGYSIMRDDRLNSKGGGVLIMVKECIIFSSLAFQKHEDIEVCSIQINMKYEKICISLFYCPPWISESVIDYIEQYFIFLRSHNGQILILGDFNLPKIDWETLTSSSSCMKSQKFLSLINDCGLTQIVETATHEKNNILDILLCESPSLISSFSIMPPFTNTCDHFSFHFSIIGRHQIDAAEKRRDFRNMDVWNIRKFLNELPWHSLFANSNAQAQYDVFLDAISFIIQECVPLRKCNFKNNYHRSTVKIIESRNRAFRRYQKSKSLDLFRTYKLVAQKAQKAIRKDVFLHEKRILESKNDKKFFKFINSKLKSKSSALVLTDDDKNLITDKKKISDTFNNYFASVFTHDNTLIPDFLSRTQNMCSNDIDFSPTNVCKILKKISMSMSEGPDAISNFFLKQVSLEISLPLSLLFESFFQSGVIPRQWRQAIVCPVFKQKGNPSDVKNYRPISLTSTVCKVMESIILKHMYDHLIRNNLLSKEQYGFRPGFSTELQLLACFEHWTREADNSSSQVNVVYLDFAKAFDSVSHEKLLLKLQRYGFESKILAFIRNFMTDRSQTVQIGKARSQSLPVLSGVPQGSVLGPLLFIIYINDIVDVLKFSSVKIYADDCKLFLSCRCLEDCRKLQEDLKSLEVWAQEWQLNLSFSKCKTITLGRKHVDFEYELGGNKLEEVKMIRDLGITVSASLKPSAHCERISNIASFKSALIFRSFVTKEPNFMMRLFKTYILSKMHYGSVVFNPWLAKDIIRIEQVLRRFSRRLPGFKDMSYERRLSILNMHSLEYVRLENDLKMAFKMIKGLTCLDSLDFFCFSGSDTRQVLVNRFCSHDFCKFYFTNRIVKVYNALPKSVTQAKTISEFKTKLSQTDLRQFMLKFPY